MQRSAPRLGEPTATAVRGTPGTPSPDLRSLLLFLSASTFPPSAARPSSATALPHTPAADGRPSTTLCLPIPHTHVAVRERIHTCPGQRLCQHPFSRGMCRASLHLRLPLWVFQSVGFRREAERKDKWCSGGESHFSRAAFRPPTQSAAHVPPGRGPIAKMPFGYHGDI